MIKAVFIINRAGKIRLFKFYGDDVSIKCRQQLIKVLAEVIRQRMDLPSKRACNFVDQHQLEQLATTHTKTEPFTTDDVSLRSFRRLLNGSTLVYRTYATLHFVMLVDDGENLLGTNYIRSLYE